MDNDGKVTKTTSPSSSNNSNNIIIGEAESKMSTDDDLTKTVQNVPVLVENSFKKDESQERKGNILATAESARQIVPENSEITTANSSNGSLSTENNVSAENKNSEIATESPNENIACDSSSSPLQTNTDVSEPGLKDKEGFLAPPPASTLLIRRKSGTTGTYVVSPGASLSPQKDEGSSESPTPQTIKPPQSFLFGLNPPIKRRPGRPVGSVGPYKRKRLATEISSDYPTGEVRVSSRQSTSIFKHDITGAAVTPVAPVIQEDSPWVYPTAIRTSQLCGGKPPISGFRRPYTKGGHKRESFDNIDPLTGKRRYTRRKKFGDERRDTLTEDFSGESDSETDKAIEFHLSDNGIWRPTDDFRLIINMESRGKLDSVFLGVKFSCYFTYKEIEDRWRKLMYNDKASLVAQNAINALHPDVKAKIYYQSLFSEEEEKLISGIKVASDANPDIKLFQVLLQENPHVFNKHRTPRSLLMHWLDMKDFCLLANQNVLDYNPGRNFEDFEDMICENDDDSDDDIESESVLLELRTEERCLKKKLRLLDDEINAWQTITGQIIEDGMKNNTLPPLPTDFDGKTFALLRGKEVYYGMTSREIILGRSTKECKVDADLTEEGSSSKISRKQAIIRLKRMGRFVIINKGKRPIFVGGKVVPYRCAAILHDQSVIQISQINLIFFINEALIAKVIDRDVSGEIYASFKDLENETSTTSAPVPQPTTVFQRHYPLYTNSVSSYGVVQSNYMNSTGTTASSSDYSSSVTTTSSATPLVGDTDVPLCQPPASYVTIS